MTYVKLSKNESADQKLSDQVVIAEVVQSEGVHLRKIGDKLQGLCPLHKEKSPSFTVYPEKNTFYCFGCQIGGDPIKFIQELMGYDFKAACNHLGIKLNSRGKPSYSQNTKKPLKPVKQSDPLQNAIKENEKLLKAIALPEIKPEIREGNIKEKLTEVSSNLIYEYPIFKEKIEGKNLVNLTGKKTKIIKDDGKKYFKWDYILTKKPKNKASYKGITNTYSTLRDAGITSDDIPFYYQDKIPKDTNYLILTEGEKDTQVLSEILGFTSITNHIQMRENSLSKRLKKLKENNSNLSFILIFSDNDKSGLNQAKEKFLACVNNNIPCLAINPATKKPIFNFNDNDITEGKKGYDITDLINELVGQNMNQESIIREINKMIKECYQLATEFKEVTENKTKKKTHIFDNLKSLNSELIDITNPESYLIPEIMPKGEFIQLIASPKVGKTLLAYDLIGSLILSEDFLGYEIKEENKTVLLIQLDESFNTLNARLIQRLGIDSCEHLKIVDRFKLIKDDLEGLEYCLEKLNPSLVVIDSLRATSTGTGLDENSASIAEPILAIRDMLMTRNINGVLIHHATKNKEMKNTDKSRGSSAIAAAFYATWLLESLGDNMCRLNIAGRCAPKSFDLSLDTDYLHYTVIQNEENNSQEIVDDLPVSKQLREKIPNLIGHGINTKKALLNHLNCNENTLRKVLTELVKKGILIRKGNGKTNPAIFHLKDTGSSNGSSRSSVDQVMDQVKTHEKSRDTAIFDPSLDQGKGKILDRDQILPDPDNTLSDKTGSNISETLTSKEISLDPEFDPSLDPLDLTLDPVNFPTEDQIIEFFSGQEIETHLVDVIAHFENINIKESLPDQATQKIYSDYLSQLVNKDILTVDSNYYKLR